MFLVMLCGLYLAVFVANFAFSDSVVYGYTGLTYNPPSLGYTVCGIVMAMIPSFWMPIALTRPSFICYWWLYLAVFVPTMVIPFHVLDEAPANVLQFCLALLACFTLLGAAHLFPAIRIRSIPVNEKVLYSGMLLALFGMLVAIVSMRGFSVSLSISDMFTRRLAIRESVLGGSLFAYAYSTIRSSVVPMLLARGITTKSAFWIAMGLLGAVFCFSLSAERTTFFTPLYLVLLSVLVVRRRTSFGAWFVGGVTFVLMLCMSEYLLFEGSMLSTVFSRRLLIVPSQVTAYYFEYYSNHELTYYSESLLKWFVAPRQPLSTGSTIGEAFFHNAETNCTGNIWATGFSEFGFTGMFIATGMLGIIFRTMDGMVSKRNFTEGCLIAGLLGMSWSEVSLFTSLLSNGVISSILLLSLHPRPKKLGGQSLLRGPARPGGSTEHLGVLAK